MILVTALALPCAVVGWELNFIRQRQAALVWLKEGAGWAITTAEYQQLPDQAPHNPSGPAMEIPAWRRWLGDEPIAAIGFERRIPKADRERCAGYFQRPRFRISSHRQPVHASEQTGSVQALLLCGMISGDLEPMDAAAIYMGRNRCLVRSPRLSRYPRC